MQRGWPSTIALLGIWVLFGLSAPEFLRAQTDLDPRAFFSKEERIIQKLRYAGRYEESLRRAQMLDSVVRQQDYVDPRPQILTWCMMAEIYRVMGQRVTALRYLHQALQKVDPPQSDEEIRSWLQVTRQLSNLYFEKEQHDSAWKYNQALLAFVRDPTNSYAEAEYGRSVMLEAALLHLSGQLDKALQQYRRAGRLLHQNPADSAEHALYYRNLSGFFLETGRTDSALIYGRKALESARKNRVPLYQREAHRLLERIHRARGDFEKVYNHFRRLVQITDSLESQEMQSTILALEKKYQTAQKEQENAVLKNQLQQEAHRNRMLTAGSLFMVLFLGLMAYTIHQTRKSRRLLSHQYVEAARQTKLIEQQAAQLREEAQRKSMFFASISHELRTPLTLIQGPLERLARTQKGPSGFQQALQTAMHYTQVMKRQVDSLLHIKRLESMDLQPQWRPISIAEKMEVWIAAHRTHAEMQGVALRLHNELDDLPSNWGWDVSMMEQVVNNLLTNAIKFSPKLADACVTVHLQRSDGKPGIEIRVCDQGPGIPPAWRQAVFEPYQQTPDQRHQGTGLGLYIAQRMARALGGTVCIASSSEQGTCMLFRCPAQTDPDQMHLEAVPAPLEELSDPHRALPSVGTEIDARVLVVDDHPDMRQYIRQVLRPAYHVSEAENGPMALKMIQEIPFDLVCTDLMMPDMDGLTFIDNIRALPKGKYLPVLVITARSAGEIRVDAIQHGADAVLTKPFLHTELLAHASHCIQRYRNQRLALEKDPIHNEHAAPLQDPWLKSLIAWLDDQITAPELQVNDVADYMHMSLSSLNRKLKPRCGMTAHALIRERRMLKAKKLIETEPELDVQTLCFRVGYQKSSYFSQRFEERFGIRPDQMLRERV